MLVVSRKRGERIVIASDIVVTVVEVRGGHVKLGFDCPKHIPVRRNELPERPLPLLPNGAGPQSESPYLPEFA